MIKTITHISNQENVQPNYYCMDMESENINDAKMWLENDEMVAIVSELHGGIIGYIHQSHEEEILNLLTR